MTQAAPVQQEQDASFEGNIGLCYLAADIICRRRRDLQPHYENIAEDLKAKLWKIVEGGGFDPSRNFEFSTYAMPSLINEYKYIVRLYTGESTWRKYDKPERSIEAASIADMIGGELDPIENFEFDSTAKILVERCMDLADDGEQREFLNEWVRNGGNVRLAERTLGMYRGKGGYAMRRFIKTIRKHVEQNSEFANDCTEAIGVKNQMTKYAVTISLPDPVLSPNKRAHWAVKAAASKGLRNRTFNVLCDRHPSLFDQQWETATIQYKFYFAVNRHRDDDNFNAMMKSARDAFGPPSFGKNGQQNGAGSGIMANDCGFTQLQTVMGIDKENPRVEIHFERTGGE